MAESKRNIALVTLQLCACVLNNEVPMIERLTEKELEDLYRFSTFHSITALVCEGLERLGYNKKEIPDFCLARDKAVRKNLMLDTERGKLLSFLEQNGIWYMPLKGIVLKDLYPMMGLRQMSDNDILFDGTQRKAVRDWFSAHDYKATIYNKGTHDVYCKKPIYHYEMHVSLYEHRDKAAWHKYYGNIRERLVKDPDKNYAYHFTVDDFYIYFLAHGFRHFDNGGIGLRFLLDLYVYLRAHRDAMDLTYIGSELELLGLVEFERDCRELALCIFPDIRAFDFNRLTQEHQELLLYFLTSGTYGTIINRVRKTGRFKYILKKMFPGTDVLRTYCHPIFRYKILLPLGWICNAFKILFTRPGRAGRVLRTAMKTKKE